MVSHVIRPKRQPKLATAFPLRSFSSTTPNPQPGPPFSRRRTLCLLEARQACRHRPSPFRARQGLSTRSYPDSSPRCTGYWLRTARPDMASSSLLPSQALLQSGSVGITIGTRQSAEFLIAAIPQCIFMMVMSYNLTTVKDKAPMKSLFHIKTTRHG